MQILMPFPIETTSLRKIIHEKFCVLIQPPSLDQRWKLVVSRVDHFTASHGGESIKNLTVFREEGPNCGNSRS